MTVSLQLQLWHCEEEMSYTLPDGVHTHQCLAQPTQKIDFTVYPEKKSERGKEIYKHEQLLNLQVV